MALVVVSAPIAPSLVTPTAGATVPGQPGTPQASTVVYSEDFENGTDNTATGAQSYSAAGSTPYVGAGGQTYTGSPSWINAARCNGVILSYANTTTPPWAQSTVTNPNRCADSAGVRSYQFLRMLALAMGQQLTPASPTTDHIDSSYTECQSTAVSGGLCDIIPSGPTNGVMFKTVTPIPVTAGHYYAFHVDTAYMNCKSSTGPDPADPGYQFAWTDAGNVAHPIGAPLDGCLTANTSTSTSFTQTVTSTVGGLFGTATKDVRVNSMTTDQAFQATSSTLGIQMWNTNGTTNGNDGAFDNVRLIDVTPQLDKSFSPTTIAAGGTSTLTLTVTNTTDLDAKQDWSITDALPAGLKIASPPAVGGTCAAGSTAGAAYSVTAAAGSGSIAVTGGDLAAGQASCTITVNVTASTPATYSNGPSNITSNLNPPGTATLTVTPTCALPAPIYTVDNGTGLTPATAPELISYDTAGNVLATVPLTTASGANLLAPVTDVAMSSNGSKLYGIAVPTAGTPTLYTFDPSTGRATATIAVTGITWANFTTPDALSVLPDGRILIGAAAGTDNRKLYAIDPATGVATLYATLPTGYFSAGDFLTLPDGTVLVLASQTAVPTTTLFRYDPVAGTFVAVGSVPGSTGATQVGTMVYLAGSDGKLRTLGTSAIPTTTSAANLPTTVLASLAAGSVYNGATSAQDASPVVCLNATKSAAAVTGPDASGVYSASYTVKEINSGTAASYGALTDTPAFAANLVPTGATWTGPLGSGSATAPASGPFSFVLAPAGTLIAGSTTDTYAVTVTFKFADNTVPPACGGPGTGLFNAVTVPGGQETSTSDDSACDTPPTRFGVYLHKVGPNGSGATVSLAGSTWTLQAAAAGGGPGPVISTGVQPVAGQTGEFQLQNLQPGTYWLTETKAPSGYELLGEAIKFVVSSTGAVSITGGASPAITVGTHTGSPEIVVGDQGALVMPFAGGPGTRAYALGGFVLLGLSGVFALLYRRPPPTRGRRVRR
ncbi:MAG: SpaA isopeptide-forming pilin-related protein [Marmoricola sp.]